MQTIEVPRQDWTRTLNEFAAIHQGWLISLEVLSPEMGAQREIHNLPLLGVSAEQIDGNGTITISAARSAGEHVSHTIHVPTRMHIERTDQGADVALQVESGDGVRTILRFRVTALPETLDGIVHR